MKVVYVAGAIKASNAWEREKNIRRAEEVALAIWKMGAAAICVHSSCRFFEGVLPDGTWYEGDLEILKRCDAMILVEGWEGSRGTERELDFAIDNKIQAFHTLADLRQWLILEGRTQ